MKVVCVILLLASSAFGQGAQFPNMRWVQPDPNTGRPMLVHTSCGSPDDGPESWAAAINVYTDPNVELFVDQNCIVASAQIGFASTGKYSVDLYTFYKDDAFCRLFASVYSPPSHPNPGFLKECHSVIYKHRKLNVDTRNKTMLMNNTRLEDSRGGDLGPVHDDKGWQPIADFAVCVDKITELVQEKSAYSNKNK